MNPPILVTMEIRNATRPETAEVLIFDSENASVCITRAVVPYGRIAETVQFAIEAMLR